MHFLTDNDLNRDAYILIELLYCKSSKFITIFFHLSYTFFSDNLNKEIKLVEGISSAIETIYTRVIQADDGFNKMGHEVTIFNLYL